MARSLVTGLINAFAMEMSLGTLLGHHLDPCLGQGRGEVPCRGYPARVFGLNAESQATVRRLAIYDKSPVVGDRHVH